MTHEVSKLLDGLLGPALDSLQELSLVAVVEILN